MKTNTLFRMKEEGVIGGVAAGLAHHFGIDRLLVRILFVLSFFFFKAVPVVIVYILLWALLPVGEKNSGNVEVTKV
ncbi:MAG: PspC domain-containing protein [Spirosomaceae bacterium]|jgi:phage shock protein C|nr:PspC domain-containing protein [Spirosomataceae bacterium]